MTRTLAFVTSAALVLLAGCTAEHSSDAEPPPPPPPAPPVATLAESQAQSPPVRPVVRGESHPYVARPAEPQGASSGAFAVAGPATDSETYGTITANPVVQVDQQPVSTFSVDVDTGSYANIRRLLVGGQLPPADAVRTEELLNYFDHAYPPPTDPGLPFSITTELAAAPWDASRHLLLVGLQGYKVPRQDIPSANLVFLVDSSGSMQAQDKLPLLKRSFALLAGQLRPEDRIAIVAYAGSAGLVLPSTPARELETVLAALDRLHAGGSTNGGAGIDLAYAVAREHYIEGGVNRVVLATDGDFNVGPVGIDELKQLVADQRRSGVGLTVLGLGTGNYNEHVAEQLANSGNGNYYYIDTLNEGRKVLVDQLAATVLTIAADVKVQLEFNPAVVRSYRLIGYENRLLAREQFDDDRVDAGEIGAGHSVTALYELTLVHPGRAGADRIAAAQLRLRYKQPGEDESRLLEQAIGARPAATASPRLRFAASVAGFAELLRQGDRLGDWSWPQLQGLATGAVAAGTDADGYRAEFLALIERAGLLAGAGPVVIAQ